MLGRNNVEDMSVVEMFLQEVGLDEGQKDEIVAIIKGMGELFTYSCLCIFISVRRHTSLGAHSSLNIAFMLFIPL
jgi:hypothetical protein